MKFRDNKPLITVTPQTLSKNPNYHRTFIIITSIYFIRIQSQCNKPVKMIRPCQIIHLIHRTLYIISKSSFIVRFSKLSFQFFGL